MILHAYRIVGGALQRETVLTQPAPKGGWDYRGVLDFVAGNIGTGAQAILDRAAQAFGVYVVAMEDAPAGQRHDYTIALGTASTGHATDVTINGQVTFGYSFVDEPDYPSGAEWGQAVDAYVAASAAASRAGALQRLGDFLQAWAVGQGLRAYTSAEIAAAGSAWYADAASYAAQGAEEAKLAALFADAQVEGLIP